MWEKLKYFWGDDALFYSVVLVLVAVVSFGLGQRSVEDVRSNASISSTGVVIETFERSESVDLLENTADQVVVSKSGTKYHLLSCPGAGQIKEENKVFFDSPVAAQAAGYSAAANCPGL